MESVIKLAEGLLSLFILGPADIITNRCSKFLPMSIDRCTYIILKKGGGKEKGTEYLSGRIQFSMIPKK